jgi:hypothetical protein
MKTTLTSCAFAGLLMLGAAPALADDVRPHHDACPFTDRLRHWTDVDNFTAIVEAGVNQRYKITFMNDCREMKYSIFARVQSHSLCLTPGDSVKFGPRHGIPNTCVVQSIEALPPREPLRPAADY